MIEAREMWRFVARKSARQPWEKIPATYRKQAVFHTGLDESYVNIIPPEQHWKVIKQTAPPHHIERFNCTMRRGVSRLARDSPAFSKKLADPIGAVHYFIRHYNQTGKAVELPANKLSLLMS
jgi:hypothetical protein